MKTGRPPETRLHCSPISRKAWMAPFVAREISPLRYQPPKLLYFSPYIFHTSSMTCRLASISEVMSPVSQYSPES